MKLFWVRTLLLVVLVECCSGYFYKENTVTEDHKQCFCEVNSDPISHFLMVHPELSL